MQQDDRAIPSTGCEPVGMSCLGIEPARPATRRIDTVRGRPIVLCEPDLEEHELLALMHRCRELALKVSVLPQLFSALGPSVEVDDVEGVTVLGINPPRPVSLLALPEARRFDLTASVVVLAAVRAAHGR